MSAFVAQSTKKQKNKISIIFSILNFKVTEFRDFFHFCTMRLFIYISFLTLFSCSSQRDEQFCRCLESSEALNAKTKEVLDAPGINKDQESELKKLREQKTKDCANYTEISAEESSKLRDACEE